MLLTIKGARAHFARIIQQVCWLVGVAGDTPTSRLASFVKETKQGTTTRGYAETIHTGHPIIEAGKGCRFHVSFSAAQVEKLANHALVRKSGHCWKTMTELSIIAKGFPIPSRPREGSGLEAPLFVLRQLIKRGCHGTRPLALDKPMVMFPPSQIDRVDKSGKVAKVYKLRLIIAAGSEQPLGKHGNIIYWHFDSAKICNSLGSFQQLEDGISVEPSAVDLYSRHFVGWSNNAGLSTGKRSCPIIATNAWFLIGTAAFSGPLALDMMATCSGCLLAGGCDTLHLKVGAAASLPPHLNSLHFCPRLHITPHAPASNPSPAPSPPAIPDTVPSLLFIS